jgi:hypothetical protein
MAKIVVIAKCKDQAKWEQGFRSHGGLFRNDYKVTKPVSYGMGEDNHVIACLEPNDLSAALKMLDSPATHEAMESDGLLRDTVQVFVLEKELAL